MVEIAGAAKLLQVQNISRETDRYQQLIITHLSIYISNISIEMNDWHVCLKYFHYCFNATFNGALILPLRERPTKQYAIDY